MSLPTTPEGIRQAAQRIESFLKDDVIADVLSRMERKFYEEFIAADTSELRVRAWAKAKVLREWDIEIKSLLDAGDKEAILASRKAEHEKKLQK